MPLRALWRDETRPGRSWLLVLSIGLGLWVASVVVYLLTGNINQIPTITQLGSFVVPITYVVWAYENGRRDETTLTLIFRAFVAGGVLGTLAASLLETYLLNTLSPWLYVGVGFIEEGTKILALMLVARNLRYRTPRDGMVLGSAVGFGFAAFESSGYALSAFLSDDGSNLRAMVETEILRGLVAPLGHGLWTGILGGLLFYASQPSRYRLRLEFWLSFVAVSLLHALWDAMPAIGNSLAHYIETGQTDYARHHAAVNPTGGTTTTLATAIQWVGLLALALLGTAWNRRLGTRFRSFHPPPPAPSTRSWHWVRP
ncbi:PrsW family intramembrane metalloprotease [Actinocorallia longicatena]|uniref:RsiW-degrading membrane proteinase PrsW (M82 family) n=1 Tax=Actinocorallia longicatena TaxID=111803 RepID=A0ABP6QJD5_9ACTN